MNIANFDRFVGNGFLHRIFSASCISILSASLALSATSVAARGLPDFTELVEQVGLSCEHQNHREDQFTLSIGRVGRRQR